MIPRIQARIGQIEDGEHNGKWIFEIFVSMLGNAESKQSFGVFGPWETREIAEQEAKNACQFVCEDYEEKFLGKKSGKYIDVKTNELKEWKNG
jgi:hypothetical protein